MLATNPCRFYMGLRGLLTVYTGKGGSKRD